MDRFANLRTRPKKKSIVGWNHATGFVANYFHQREINHQNFPRNLKIRRHKGFSRQVMDSQLHWRVFYIDFREVWAESRDRRHKGNSRQVMDPQLHRRLFYIDFSPLRAFPYLTMNTSDPCAFRLGSYRQYNEIVSWARAVMKIQARHGLSIFPHRRTNGQRSL